MIVIHFLSSYVIIKVGPDIWHRPTSRTKCWMIISDTINTIPLFFWMVTPITAVEQRGNVTSLFVPHHRTTAAVTVVFPNRRGVADFSSTIPNMTCFWCCFDIWWRLCDTRAPAFDADTDHPYNIILLCFHTKTRNAITTKNPTTIATYQHQHPFLLLWNQIERCSIDFSTQEQHTANVKEEEDNE